MINRQPLRLYRSARVIKAEEADSPDGIYCLTVDNPAIFSFEALNCTPDEFADWYLIRSGEFNPEYAEHRVSEKGEHEIWLWVREHGLSAGDELLITSDQVFTSLLNKKIEQHDMELSRLARERMETVFRHCDTATDYWEVPYQ
ncbi:hypothetical protein DC915_RS03295 [Vibrio parahaemolyticus]|jgi:hypothetical protein|uniref:Uncharacterized protein n=1 Tax=Vibrio jasicida TaxID=766224 RepID=A0AAU9QQQ5_9VIBR|nr:hypothetical protein [Vibrio parahaemolyticus]ELA8176475.1 hypothetical protein [Vibrio alginolyticus]CAH1592689.1 hypothetical protein THF1C08_320042 [Vibrio jasicida]EJE4724719.1 hypothetical protein [Vibrio parahaemolyticus]EJG0010005.1 hypothetical protein [Vibrio parahaemolyticus]